MHPSNAVSGPTYYSPPHNPIFRAESASFPRPMTKRRRLHSPTPSVLVTDDEQDDDGDIAMASAISDAEHGLDDGGSSTDDLREPSSPTLASPLLLVASPCSTHFGYRADVKGKGKARDMEEGAEDEEEYEEGEGYEEGEEYEEEDEEEDEEDGVESEDGWMGDSEGEMSTPSEPRVDFETAKAMVAAWPRLFSQALKQTLRARGHELDKAKSRDMSHASERLEDDEPMPLSASVSRFPPAPRRHETRSESSHAVQARADPTSKHKGQHKRRRANGDSRNDPRHRSPTLSPSPEASDLPGPDGSGTLPLPEPCDQDVTMVTVESGAEEAPVPARLASEADDRMVTSDVEREMLEHRDQVLRSQRRRARGIQQRRMARDAQRLQADRALRLSLEEPRSEPPPILPPSFDPLLHLPAEAQADIRASTRPADLDPATQDEVAEMQREEEEEDRVERRAESPAPGLPPEYEYQDLDDWWTHELAAPQPTQRAPDPLPEVPPYMWPGDARGGIWSPVSPPPPPPFNAQTDRETLIPVRFDHDSAA